MQLPEVRWRGFEFDSPLGADEAVSDSQTKSAGAASNAQPPRTLGRYELLMPVARGGMAAVWAARLHGGLGFSKLVAIKSMLPNLSEDPRFEQMFLAEAILASKIEHPHVCRILDLGEDNGNLYLAMEWVDGETVVALYRAARDRGARIPIPLALRIGLGAALGLHAAHEQLDESGQPLGLVHCDVSPQNLLVTADGVVKVVDFGVARATTEYGPRADTGVVGGKISYMSPEQAAAEPLDRRTDVFALGAVLYELVTGKHPFRGRSMIETFTRVKTITPPPPIEIEPRCPPAISDAIVRALEKDPARRTPSMIELARCLDDAVSDIGGAAHASELGAFVRSLLGERLDRRRSEIKQAIQRADASRPASTPPGSNPRRLARVSAPGTAGPPSAPTPPLGQPVTTVDGAQREQPVEAPAAQPNYRASAPTMPPLALPTPPPPPPARSHALRTAVICTLAAASLGALALVGSGVVPARAAALQPTAQARHLFGTEGVVTEIARIEQPTALAAQERPAQPLAAPIAVGTPQGPRPLMPAATPTTAEPTTTAAPTPPKPTLPSIRDPGF